jgi:hypothetical protein
MLATGRVLDAIVVERARQEDIGEAKRASGIDWRSCADPDMAGGDFTRLAVLAEEFGEVANAVLETAYGSSGDEHLRDELIQVAAVAAAWVEAVDARRAPRGINAVRSALRAIYPTADEQDEWFDAPHPLLGGSAAIDLIGTEREPEVWAVIEQLQTGAVV